MGEHTPGPWVYDEERSVYLGPPAKSNRVATVNACLDDWEANVALIASAPTLQAENTGLREQRDELLEALRATLGMAQGLKVSHEVGCLYPGDDLRLKDQLTRAEATMQAARAAIAKAEGA